MQLGGRVAIVTGAGRGIGRAIALSFGREGASVVLAARTPERLSKVAAEVEASGGRALVVPTDVSREESAREMVRRTLEAFGTIDILVVNAAIMLRHFVHELPAEEARAMLDTNLLGAIYCCKAVLPTLYDRHEGTILFISSRTAVRSSKGTAAYGASKAALVALMQTLAVEAKPHGVRVNAISCGSVNTEIHQAPNVDGSRTDTSGYMQPEEIADVALFLVSPASRAIHGQVINVWGGVNYRDWASTDRTL